MAKKENLVLKKSALSILVFTASTLAAVGLAYFILQNTKLEKDIAKNYFSTVEDLDDLENNLKITQEIGLLPEFTQLVQENPISSEDTLANEPASYPVSYTTSDQENDLSKKYSPEQIQSFLETQTFTFQLLDNNQENGNKILTTKEYFDSLVNQLESFDPPTEINDDVKNLIPAVKEYNRILEKYDGVFVYLGEINDSYSENIQSRNDYIDYESFLNKVNALEVPENASEYKNLVIGDFEVLKLVTSQEAPVSYSQDEDSNNYIQGVETDEKVKLNLKSNKENYSIVNFLSEEDRDNIEKASGQISDSMKKIEEYKKKEIPQGSTSE